MKRWVVSVGETVITEEHKKRVLEVLASGQISPGSVSREFENRFARIHGAEYGVFVNSGTDALRIALGALKEKYGWEDGSGVLCPSLTFVATLNVILQNGLKPVLVDCNEFDYGIDADLAWRKKGVVAMMPAHLFGQNLNRTGSHQPMSLKDLAEFLSCSVIEDSCESTGSGKIFGDVACYSSYACHMISTGVGGMAVTNDKRTADLMRSLANHGRSYSHIPGHRLSKNIAKRFVFDRIGYSSRGTEMQAALGMVELDLLPTYLKARKQVGLWLEEELSDLNDVLKIPYRSKPQTWMMYPLEVRPEAKVSKWKLCQYLEENGIETRELLPFLRQPCYKAMNFNLQEFPNALNAQDRGFYIGSHPGITRQNVAYVGSIFRKFFKRSCKS